MSDLPTANRIALALMVAVIVVYWIFVGGLG
jgi:hypothetical protein